MTAREHRLSPPLPPGAELLGWQARWYIEGGRWTAWKKTTEQAASESLERYPDTYKVRAVYAVPATLTAGGGKL